MARAAEFFAFLWVIWGMAGSVAWVFDWWTPQQLCRWLITLVVWLVIVAIALDGKDKRKAEEAAREGQGVKLA